MKTPDSNLDTSCDRTYLAFLQRARRAQSGPVVSGVRCLEWFGKRNKKGYGLIQSASKWRLAHRWSFACFRGPIPSEHCVLHSCDNPRCVEPAHLFTGSNLDNIRDRVSKGRGLLGEKNHQAKLDALKVIAIRSEYAAGGTTQQQVADKYGITREAVREIVLRRVWRHVA